MSMAASQPRTDPGGWIRFLPFLSGSCEGPGWIDAHRLGQGDLLAERSRGLFLARTAVTTVRVTRRAATGGMVTARLDRTMSIAPQRSVLVGAARLAWEPRRPDHPGTLSRACARCRLPTRALVEYRR